MSYINFNLFHSNLLPLSLGLYNKFISLTHKLSQIHFTGIHYRFWLLNFKLHFFYFVLTEILDISQIYQRIRVGVIYYFTFEKWDFWKFEFRTAMATDAVGQRVFVWATLWKLMKTNFFIFFDNFIEHISFGIWRGFLQIEIEGFLLLKCLFELWIHCTKHIPKLISDITLQSNSFSSIFRRFW